MFLNLLFIVLGLLVIIGSVTFILNPPEVWKMGGDRARVPLVVFSQAVKLVQAGLPSHA